MDQAQHFTGKASAATSVGSHASADFQAGLEASVNVRHICPAFHHLLTQYNPVFALAQRTRECQPGQALVRIKRQGTVTEKCDLTCS